MLASAPSPNVPIPVTPHSSPSVVWVNRGRIVRVGEARSADVDAWLRQQSLNVPGQDPMRSQGIDSSEVIVGASETAC
jgi:hypothetical protein